jgi:hypothetical protein
MDLIPQLLVDDGLMLAGIGLALVDRIAAIDAVHQHPVEISLVDQGALLVAEC